MTVYELVAAAVTVVVSGWAVLLTTREPRPPRARRKAPAHAAPRTSAPEPDAVTEPDPQLELPLDVPAPPEPRPPSTLEALHFSDELRARPARRVSSALALLTITLIAAGGLAALIYRGLTSLAG